MKTTKKKNENNLQKKMKTTSNKMTKNEDDLKKNKNEDDLKK